MELPQVTRERESQASGMRSALWLPLFDGLADPVVVARLAAEAEEAGWHGVFVWDHLRWQAPVRQVADPWITLAAIPTNALLVSRSLVIGLPVIPPCVALAAVKPFAELVVMLGSLMVGVAPPPVEAPPPLVAPPPALCTDNGAMIAWAGAERLALGLTDPLDVAPRARWPLDQVTKAAATA